MKTPANNSCSVQHVARALAWGEAFVLVPLHAFWVLSKSTPFVAENTYSAAVAIVPLAVMLVVGLAIWSRRARAAVVGVEWLLHLTAAACLAIVLVYVALRDPFNPILPITWPLCFWSVTIAFVLLSDLALHERMRGDDNEPSAPAGRLLPLGVGIALWVALVWLAAGMAWVPYFLTASLIFHAVMAPTARRLCDGGNICPAVRVALLPRAAALVESLFAITLMLAALLRFMFVCERSGTAELKYFQFVDLCVNPWFAAGVVLAMLGNKFRLAFITHGLAVALFLLAGRETAWPISPAMGYGLTVLYIASAREGAAGYAVSVAATAVVWFLGAMSFILAGLVIDYEVGLGFVNSVLWAMSVSAPLLYVVWLGLAAVGWWRSQDAPFRDDSDEVSVSASARCLAYAAVWAAVLVPIGCLVATTMWPPVWFRRSAQVVVDRPAGLCHAGSSRSDKEYKTLDELGVDMMRVDFHWRSIQPGPETWNVGRYDAYLDAAESHGVKVLALFAYDNNKAERSPTGSQRNHYIAPEDVPLFLEYVRRTVARYKDRVYAWEIWNEPDIDRFWEGTMKEFYELARQTAETVREVHPEARILGTAMTGPMGALSARGIEGMHASGALDKVDHPTMHMYLSDPRAYYNEFLKTQNAAAKYGHEGPVWITELGDPDGGVYSWRASSSLLAEHAIKSYTIATSLGIEKLVWYCYHDSGAGSQQKNPRNSEAFFGLVDPAGQWKPAAHAYSLFSKNCSNSVIRDDLVKLSGGIASRQLRTALYRRDDGHTTLILWFEPSLRPDTHARVAIDLGQLAKPAVMYDIESGYTKRLLDKIVDVGGKPLFITYQSPAAQTSVILQADSSPADAMWLMAAVGIVFWAAWGSGTASKMPARRGL